MSNRIDHEKKHGKKISQNAEKVWGWSSPAGQARVKRKIRYYLKYGKINANDSILEIGAGTGLFTSGIYNATKAKIVATDISEDLLIVARERNPHIEFKEADAMNLEFENEKFDVVMGNSILHHLDMEKSIKEAFRVLKKGGRIIFQEPNMLNPQIFIQKNVPFIKKWMGDSPDETAIVRWKMNKLLSDVGFIETKVFPFDFLHPITPKFLIPIVEKVGIFLEKVPFIKEIAGSVVISGRKPT